TLELNSALTEAAVRALAGCRSLHNVTTLRLFSSAIKPHAFEILTSSPLFARVETLDLRSSQVEKVGARALARWASEKMTALRFNFCNLGLPGLAALLSAPRLTRLREFYLWMELLPSLEPLASAPFASTLEVLTVGNSAVPASAVRELARVHFPR